jgi:hypothetical protein
MSINPVQLEGDGPPVSIQEPEARQMAQALRAALIDGEALAASGAPLPVRQALLRDHMPEPFSMASQIRAGDWLLVSADGGPRWDLRMVTPDSPRVGLIFQAPLVRGADRQWRVAAVNFVRAR